MRQVKYAFGKKFMTNNWRFAIYDAFYSVNMVLPEGEERIAYLKRRLTETSTWPSPRFTLPSRACGAVVRRPGAAVSGIIEIPYIARMLSQAGSNALSLSFVCVRCNSPEGPHSRELGERSARRRRLQPRQAGSFRADQVSRGQHQDSQGRQHHQRVLRGLAARARDRREARRS